MRRLAKLLVPATLILALGLLWWGANKVRHTVNQPTAKSTDIAIPKVNEAALESMHQRSATGQFDTKAEVSNTRENPFEHYGGYVAPAAPAAGSTGSPSSAEPAAAEPTGGSSAATTSPTTGGSSGSTSTSTTGSTSIQLPTLPPELKQAGF